MSGDSSMSSGQGNNHESPLHGAVRIGSLEIVKLLVERGAKINHKEFRALDYAAGLGYSHIVKYFIQKGEDVNSSTANGETPLFFAITNGHLNVVRILVKSGANVSVLHSLIITQIQASTITTGECQSSTFLFQ